MFFRYHLSESPCFVYFQSAQYPKNRYPRCQRSCRRSRCPGEPVRQEKGWDHPTFFFLKEKKQIGQNVSKTTSNKKQKWIFSNCQPKQNICIVIRCIDIHRYVYTLGVAPRASPSNSDQPGLIPSLADPKQNHVLSTGILGGENHT